MSGQSRDPGPRRRLALWRAGWLAAALGCGLVAGRSSADPAPAPNSPAPPATIVQPSAAGAVLYVRLLKLHNDKGQVGCLLFDSKRGFPQKGEVARQGRWCPVANGQSLCTFDPIPAGVYAVACFHDEDKDREMDTGLFGIPSEGWVTSNQAKGYMGPPRFEDAKFKFSGKATELRLRMGY